MALAEAPLDAEAAAAAAATTRAVTPDSSAAAATARAVAPDAPAAAATARAVTPDSPAAAPPDAEAAYLAVSAKAGPGGPAATPPQALVEPDFGAVLRAKGMRLTQQRRRVVAAVEELGHATPDAIVNQVALDGGAELAPSTVYRNLDALETLGVVSHTHLEHGAATYHLADHADHVHLVCLNCGAVQEARMSAADELVGNLRRRYGFVADVKHLAIHGWCSPCSTAR